MLGSQAEADDAVQEAWLRVDRAGADGVDNVGGWLTTVTSRVCLNVLRTRRSRPVTELDTHIPDPVITLADDAGPEQEAVLADSVGLALLVVLESLSPAERLAFVLHDLFAVPFDEIATIVDRTPEATRQLASRARRRVQGGTPSADADPARRRAVVDAFFAAARGGDLAGLVALLDPEVVLRSDGGTAKPLATALVHGAEAVGSRAIMFSQPHADLVPADIDGNAGVVIVVDGTVFSVMAFTIVDDRIIAIEALSDPDRLPTLADLA
jgi:RNA polymerase sigma-70 factor (ECF subfamily)